MRYTTLMDSPPKSLFAACFFSTLMLWVASACNQTSPPNTAAATEASNTASVATGGTSSAAPKASGSTKGAVGNRALTVASWNMEWLSEENNRGPVSRDDAAFARLAKYARRLDADLIAVQEVQSVAALARVFDPTRYSFHITADASPQRTGFVYRSDIDVQPQPDYTALAAGQLRSGADVAIEWGGARLRLLSVHLKSGCFAKSMSSGDDCRKFARQVPIVERWLDERAKDGTPFAVLGDFNRRFFHNENDSVWRAWDDADPPESDLFSPTQGQRSTCRGRRGAPFVDHLVFSRSMTKWLIPGSFREWLYDAGDRGHGKPLSDHCPIAITLRASDSGPPTSAPAPSAPAPTPAPSAAATGASSALSAGVTSGEYSGAVPTTESITVRGTPVKGNISRGGARYYHTADCPNYERVKVNTSKGERAFTDPAAAEAAGFRRSPDCPKRPRF